MTEKEFEESFRLYVSTHFINGFDVPTQDYIRDHAYETVKEAYYGGVCSVERKNAIAIDHTKNKQGMKCSFEGARKNKGYAASELSKHYYEARDAWLSGNLETVAEFFGLYV